MNRAASAATNTQELLKITQSAQDILASADTIFPFTLFPDTITIDRVKVTIKRRYFFELAKTTSIQIEDVLNAESHTGPFYGSIRIWTRFYADDPLVIDHLKNEDALAIKRILQGFIIARQKNVDCTHIDREALTNLLHELGKEARV